MDIIQSLLKIIQLFVDNFSEFYILDTETFESFECILTTQLDENKYVKKTVDKFSLSENIEIKVLKKNEIIRTGLGYIERCKGSLVTEFPKSEMNIIHTMDNNWEKMRLTEMMSLYRCKKKLEEELNDLDSVVIQMCTKEGTENTTVHEMKKRMKKLFEDICIKTDSFSESYEYDNNSTRDLGLAQKKMENFFTWYNENMSCGVNISHNFNYHKLKYHENGDVSSTPSIVYNFSDFFNDIFQSGVWISTHEIQDYVEVLKDFLSFSNRNNILVYDCYSFELVLNRQNLFLGNHFERRFDYERIVIINHKNSHFFTLDVQIKNDKKNIEVTLYDSLNLNHEDDPEVTSFLKILETFYGINGNNITVRTHRLNPQLNLCDCGIAALTTARFLVLENPTSLIQADPDDWVYSWRKQLDSEIKFGILMH